MRVLYTVCSDGLGHAMRARVVAEELTRAGHQLLLAAFGRPAELLRRWGFDVLAVRGLTCTYDDGAVRRRSTVLRALTGAPARIRHNARAALDGVRAFAPDVILTDFSGFACYARLVTGCPVVSIDHQHVLDRFCHPHGLTKDFRMSFEIARATVMTKTPGCARFIVTSFYFPAARRGTEATTTLTGPLLRPDLAQLTTTHGEHVVVYQTAPPTAALLDALYDVPNVQFRVYGSSVSQKTRNVELKTFGERSFLQDLASARAVVNNGGYSATSEAVCLGKPVLSIPLAHQGEQHLNAAWLEHLGLGMRGTRLSPDLLRRFVTRFSEPQTVLDPRLATGTRDVMTEVKRAIAEVT